MARKTAIVTYKNDDKDFKLEFKQLSTSKSLGFMMFMAKILGGRIGKVFGSMKGDFKGMENVSADDFNMEKIGDAVFGLFERIEETEVIDKLNVLFGSVTLEGEQIDVDHFMFDGEPTLVFKVATKALEVNYKSFLQGSSGLIGKLTSTMKIMQNSKESTSDQT